MFSSAKEKIKDILKGIDKTEIESEEGWWETSTGAEFGKKKLEMVLEVINEIEKETEECLVTQK